MSSRFYHCACTLYQNFVREQFRIDYIFYSFMMHAQNWPDLKPVVFVEIHGLQLERICFNVW